eukprot:4253320-Amphidinium_carterae.1
MSAQTSGPSTGLSSGGSMFYQDQDEQTWEAEEWPDGGEEAEVLDEEEAQWIWAQGQTGRPMSYRQPRSNMNQHRLARGYPPTATTAAKAATAGTAGKGRKGKGKRDLDEILSKKSRCARCGQIGHWARSCSAPDTRQMLSLDEEPAQEAGTNPGHVGAQQFFLHGHQPEESVAVD